MKICEGSRQIKVKKKVHDDGDGKSTSKKERKSNSAAQDSDSDIDDDDNGGSSDDDDDDDQEEEIREKTWSVGSVLAEASIRGLTKGAKIEVTVNIGGDMNVLVTAREVGGKGGVRGTVYHASSTTTTNTTLQNGRAG